MVQLAFLFYSLIDLLTFRDKVYNTGFQGTYHTDKMSLNWCLSLPLRTGIVGLQFSLSIVAYDCHVHACYKLINIIFAWIDICISIWDVSRQSSIEFFWLLFNFDYYCYCPFIVFKYLEAYIVSHAQSVITIFLGARIRGMCHTFPLAEL